VLYELHKFVSALASHALSVKILRQVPWKLNRIIAKEIHPARVRLTLRIGFLSEHNGLLIGLLNLDLAPHDNHDPEHRCCKEVAKRKHDESIPAAYPFVLQKDGRHTLAVNFNGFESFRALVRAFYLRLCYLVVKGSCRLVLARLAHAVPKVIFKGAYWARRAKRP
jgi:hypothetical protein